MLTLARAFGLGEEYSETLRNNPDEALKYLRSMLTSWFQPAYDDFIVVLSSGGAGNVGSSSGGNVIHVGSSMMAELNAAANAAGGVYPTYDIPSQDAAIVARINRYNELPMGNPAVAYVGTVPALRAMTEQLIAKLAGTGATTPAVTITVEKLPIWKNWKFWAAVGGATVLGGTIFAAARRR